MLLSKLVPITVWWTSSLAAVISEGNDDCAAFAKVDTSLGASVKLQQPGTAHHTANVQQHSACDWRCYLDRYPDVRAATTNLPVKAKEHWYSSGQNEGRDCTCRGMEVMRKQPEVDAAPGVAAGDEADIFTSKVSAPARLLEGRMEPQIERRKDKCLNFLHIPKTAGATMEQIRQERVQQLGNGTLGPGWALGESILKTVNCTSPSTEKPGACLLSDSFGHSGECVVFHVPPHYDSKIASGYEGCDTFCIVRHPLAKAVSQHVFLNGQCDAQQFARKIRNKSIQLQSEPFKENCHWVRQVMYAKHCQRILRFENLEEEFNSLMKEYGYPIVLGEHHNDHNRSHCDLGEHPERIPLEALQWIQRYYQQDYEEFGYTMSTRLL